MGQVLEAGQVGQVGDDGKFWNPGQVWQVRDDGKSWNPGEVRQGGQVGDDGESWNAGQVGQVGDDRDENCVASQLALLQDGVFERKTIETMPKRNRQQLAV